MSVLSISIFGNKSFLEIMNESKLFSNYQTIHYDDLDLCIKDAITYSHLVLFFVNQSNKNFFKKFKSKNIPMILIAKSSDLKNLMLDELMEKLDMPFRMLELKKMATVLIAKYEFKKNSLIQLSDYTIDKNERKIKKDQLQLQLSEKEINFLILFSKNKEPISRNIVLKNVWNYSSESETHTVETHIHRLRKKILEKFGDDNFIKNNSKGYYI